MNRPFFRDRAQAGQALGAALESDVGRPDLLVLALPRGGVPVGYEVARALAAPLDLFLVRKLGVPGHEELAMGAIASGGVRVVNEDVLSMLGIPPAALDPVAEREQAELRRREREYRDDRPPPDVRGRAVILVDDGLATGSTMRAAVKAVRALGPTSVTVAVPVGAAEICQQLRREADRVVCLATPEPFHAVGLWYADFSETSDVEVRELLARASREHAAGTRPRSAPGAPAAGALIEQAVRVAELDGDLVLPDRPAGIVLFAHGSGSSRHSSRNRFVARELQDAGLATLLLDLLTPEEEVVDERTAELRFDIGLLGRRVVEAIAWTRAVVTPRLPIGLFGASTGAAAALVAAAERTGDVAAVVSRGGRPDLAGAALPRVLAPTLLIVGGDDRAVLDLNREAQANMRAETRLEIVPGATHLFEEPGALEAVARLAREWLVHFLGAHTQT